MTQNNFVILCNLHTIAPELVLENDKIRDALAKRDDKEVERILTEEF